jgi:UDP-glucose 4-epimerase
MTMLLGIRKFRTECDWLNKTTVGHTIMPLAAMGSGLLNLRSPYPAFTGFVSEYRPRFVGGAEMRVLILGGAGDVGSHVTKALIQRGHGVTILDRAQAAAATAKNRSVTYVQGDIADRTLVKEAVCDKDAVIHLAWSFSDDPCKVFEQDIKGHLNVLEALSKTDVRSLIYTSTATVYGRAVTRPVTEDHPCLLADARKPLYALGKYTAEELCRIYHRSRNLPITILRFWWAFGDTIGGRHLRELIRKCLNDEPLEMVSGAGGAFVTMPDLANAMMSIVENPAPAGHAYNLGSLFLTWEEIGTMMVEITQSRSPICLVPADEWRGPAFLNETWELNWDKAERELGYKPGASPGKMRYLFGDALRTCIDRIKAEG